MLYELKHFDTPLIRFSAESGADPDIRIIWADETKQNLFPLDLDDVTGHGMESWIRHRTIPRNRAYVESVLSSMGLSSNRPFDIMKVSKGLSLNDCYWVTEEGFEGSFDRFNLYENRFSRILGQIAFTGYGTGLGEIITSSPELTTNGILRKCWRRDNGVIRLYKGGTEGASNTGNEPYSEYLAAQIAQAMGVHAISYGLSRWKGIICSTCDLFTSKDISYVPIGRIVRHGGMSAVRRYYEQLGEAFIKELDDMIVFDAVILNTDRHFGNFGLLVNSRTNEIVSPAPLFDHGNSLLNFAGRDALMSKEAILKYADTLLPCVYDDYIGEAKKVMTHEHRNRLRRILDFRFKKHSRYNLSKQRMDLVETVLHSQVRRLID